MNALLLLLIGAASAEVNPTHPSNIKLNFKKVIDIPCIGIPFLGSMIKPCGNQTIGLHGLNVSTPFGVVHVPGASLVDKELEKVDNYFSAYTGYFVAAIAGIYGLLTAVLPARRKAFIQAVKDTCAGKIEELDDTASPEELAKNKKDSMDPESDKFICKGNIYRLVAVLHPGVIGYRAWGNYVFKAGICCYMQFFLPFKITKDHFEKWHPIGVKTPLYFLLEGPAFFTTFVALASLCNLFAAKCALNVKSSATAAYFLLAHDTAPEKEDTASSAASAVEEAGAAVQKPADLKAALLTKVKIPQPPAWVLNANEKVAIIVAVTVDVFMSVALTLCIFVKIATFQGDIANVAIVAVSLYFVMDLDDKVMESDPNLVPKFRRQVLKQNVDNGTNPKWVLTYGGMAAHMINLTVPLGLAMILLIAWENVETGEHIGGNPF